MTDSLKIHWQNAELHLLSERALLWPDKNLLLLSDLHFGKTQHFRRHGMALPHQAAEAERNNLEALLRKYPDQDVCFLGDLFHSEINLEWAGLENLLTCFPGRQFMLVPGNHDILIRDHQPETLKILNNPYPLADIRLCHDPDDLNEIPGPAICGHLHPGIRLRGQARQSVRLPAFYVYEDLLILPAFGLLTGLHRPRLRKKLLLAGAVTPEGVVALKPE